ncbi:MAG: hypothetical protein KGH64_00945 [Candidatus Micrarchaeota archaeon]|nr:hypothetical protein [Candidatus Micrarchaeota archaeon]MDE1833883.1 hypothetical protein [Candidatus Micrarchaeota archaeon]MDE1859847.1 hypothetical protein [Candidatus Micrarchaeota archaeon]
MQQIFDIKRIESHQSAVNEYRLLLRGIARNKRNGNFVAAYSKSQGLVRSAMRASETSVLGKLSPLGFLRVQNAKLINSDLRITVTE